MHHAMQQFDRMNSTKKSKAVPRARERGMHAMDRVVVVVVVVRAYARWSLTD